MLYVGSYTNVSDSIKFCWNVIMVFDVSHQHEAVFCIELCIAVVVISTEGLDFTVEVIGFC
jgi:hypothetical protein